MQSDQRREPSQCIPVSLRDALAITTSGLDLFGCDTELFGDGGIFVAVHGCAQALARVSDAPRRWSVAKVCKRLSSLRSYSAATAVGTSTSASPSWGRWARSKIVCSGVVWL
ncbi:hypothetical protein A5634_24500 [Mycobacterium asiaticum]|uniref:Uncharacterized protein n=1 Tax=Mycobacterium asiaticum TaxID=1790 RepID=A0A1A3NXR4_MYCAS|nr:hypothetical protein A5634_24500 [Mycobacterium asiaticum]